MPKTTRRQTLALSAAAAVAGPATAGAAVFAPVAPYRAANVQTRVLATHARDGAFLPEALAANVSRVAGAVDRGAGEVGARLYVFSEFCLQLQQGPLTAHDWLAGAIRIPGRETDVIAKAAQRARAYVAISPVEVIAAFPGRYFVSGVIIGPSGDIVLNARKLYDLSNKTRPTDILAQWLDVFGPESLFPVADTPIGRLGAAVAMDVVWPEAVRSLMFKGAEVIVNPLATPVSAPGRVARRVPGSPDEHDPLMQVMARRVRAYENMVYMLSCNLGPTGADAASPLTKMLPSEIVDFRGAVMAASTDSSEQFVTATLDVENLRVARTTPGPSNPLAQLQASLHAAGYDNAIFARGDRFETHPIQIASEHDPGQRSDIADLVRRGVFKAPAAP